MKQFLFIVLFIVYLLNLVFIGCSPIRYYKNHPIEIKTKIIKEYKKDLETNVEWLCKEYSVLIDKRDSIIRYKNNYPVHHGEFLTYHKDGTKMSEGEFKLGKKIESTTYFNDGSKSIQLIHNQDGNDTTIYYHYSYRSNIEKMTIYKNRYNYYDIHFNPDGSIKKFPSVGIIPYPIIVLYGGYPSVLSTRLGVDLDLPSKNEHLKVFPYYLFFFIEPGLSGVKGGLGVSKKIDTYFLKKAAIQVSSHYTWYEVDWNRFSHIPVKQGLIGGDVEITFGVFSLFSIKAGPYFKFYGYSDKNLFFSIEFGFNIREFVKTFFSGAG